MNCVAHTRLFLYFSVQTFTRQTSRRNRSKSEFQRAATMARVVFSTATAKSFVMRAFYHDSEGNAFGRREKLRLSVIPLRCRDRRVIHRSSGAGSFQGRNRKWREGNQLACAGDIERLRTTKLFIPASRQETRSSGASHAPLKWIQIVSLFRYPPPWSWPLQAVHIYDDLDRIRYDTLSIGESILRPAKAPAQAPGKLNLEYANTNLLIA
jgi:hypothetical protein